MFLSDAHKPQNLHLFDVVMYNDANFGLQVHTRPILKSGASLNYNAWVGVETPLMGARAMSAVWKHV